jgi:uncharacterized protein YkwD
MRFLLLSFLLLTVTATIALPVQTSLSSPLQQFSTAWNNEKYAAAYTATNADYMNDAEKQVIHILNLMRMDPVLFEATVVRKYPEYSGDLGLRNNSYFKSLTRELTALRPLSVFTPDKTCFESAKCHALTSGPAGYVGHDRQSRACETAKRFFGECISYGYSDPLDIVMALLIDDGVPSLGHRKNFLANFRTAAVSIQPHKKYRHNAVIDFGM